MPSKVISTRDPKWPFALPPMDENSDLGNYHHPELAGGYQVVDIMFRSTSIFAQLDGFGLWPSRKTLAGFVLRKDWPQPSQIAHWQRRPRRDGSVVYRLYVIPDVSVESEFARALHGGHVDWKDDDS